MDDTSAKVKELIFGRWRSQILYTGVNLGVFDTLASAPASTVHVASKLDVDATMLYRLMRALGSLELLKEDPQQTFSLTPTGELLCKDHPQTLRGMILLEEGPEHYAVWKHLPELIREGKQDAFVREFGQSVFEYAAQNPAYGSALNAAMSSNSSMENTWVLEALEPYDFSGISHLCDVGGSHGYTLCHLLARHPHLRGTVLDLPSVIEDKALLWADRMGVGDRCTYMGGDTFKAVPSADAYIMKHVLHNWNDPACNQLLSAMQLAAPQNGKVLVIERVVPGPKTPHFSKLFDIHMLVLLNGRERTVEEYAGLLQGAGWTYLRTRYPASKMLGIVEGVKA